MVGALPEWYLLFLAADRLHCTPWEVLERSSLWFGYALTALSAENLAAQDRQNMQMDG